MLQDSHIVQLRIWVRPPWEGGWERTTLNTRAPSRPQLGRQDRIPGSGFFVQEFCGLPRDCVLHECFPRVGFKPGGQHTPATITASSEPWKIRQLGLCVCAASQYLNARENCWSLGQSVKIGRNCTCGTILPSIYGYYRGHNLVASLQLVPLQIWLLPHYKDTHQEYRICLDTSFGLLGKLISSNDGALEPLLISFYEFGYCGIMLRADLLFRRF